MGSSYRPNPTRARKVRAANQSPETRRKPAQGQFPKFHDILDRFGRALTIVAVAPIAIEASEKMAQEECALRRGIAGLDVIAIAQALRLEPGKLVTMTVARLRGEAS